MAYAWMASAYWQNFANIVVYRGRSKCQKSWQLSIVTRTHWREAWFVSIKSQLWKLQEVSCWNEADVWIISLLPFSIIKWLTWLSRALNGQMKYKRSIAIQVRVCVIYSLHPLLLELKTTNCNALAYQASSFIKRQLFQASSCTKFLLQDGRGVGAVWMVADSAPMCGKWRTWWWGVRSGLIVTTAWCCTRQATQLMVKLLRGGWLVIWWINRWICDLGSMNARILWCIVHV